MRPSKRQKFIFLSLGLTLSFWFLPQFLSAFISLVLVVLLTFLFTLYALGFDLRFPEHLIFPIYPILLTLAFWLNRPVGESFTVVLSLLTLFTFYTLFLTLNILNIATIRTVPLKKAALSTLYFLGLIIGFSNFKGVLALHLSSLPFTIYHLLLSFTLILPLIYFIQIKPSPIEEEIGPKPKVFLPEIAVLGLLSSEITLAASFLKVSSVSSSIFLTGTLFLLIGLMQHLIKKTLTKRILWEHVTLGVILMGMLIVAVGVGK